MIHQLALIQLLLSDKITTSWHTNVFPENGTQQTSEIYLLGKTSHDMASFQENQLQPFLVFFNFI